MNKKQKKLLRRIIIAAALFIAAKIIGHFLSGSVLVLIVMIASYLTVGYDILRKAWLGIRNGRPLDECFLMTVASLGAFALGIWSRSGDYDEAAAVMIFYQLGEFFQSYAVGKSRRSISELMDIRPDTARILHEDGTSEEIFPDEVEIGSMIIVRPGEKIPLDGLVADGTASLNTAALTGESIPRDVKPGDEVMSGCICLNSVLQIQTTRAFEESTASKILDLVENASSRKSKSEAFITRFARVYTPAVCAAALALAIIIPLIRLAFGASPDWPLWIYRALTFLVVSCPCALVISIPLCFFAGLGKASREGILIKGSNYLEALSGIEKIAFDKTGTLTTGNLQGKVVEVTGVSVSEEMLLEYAAHVEYSSSHPISRCITEMYKGTLDPERVSEINELSGRGIIGKVDGHSAAAGNMRLMRELEININSVADPAADTFADITSGIAADDALNEAGTVVFVAIDGVYAGKILITDTVKATAKDAVSQLKNAGIKTIMLTGDSEKAAAAAAHDLEIDEYRAELLPADKVAAIEDIGARRLAFAGDGINDAPVLARADIGIAMGALGSDAAIEAADVVLMDDELRKIPRAIAISRKCLKIVRENIAFSLAVKLACLVLSALGITNMWAAIFADVGVMIIAVLNALRMM